MVAPLPDPGHIALIAATRPSEAFVEFMAWVHSPAAFAAQVREEDLRAAALEHEERRSVEREADLFPGGFGSGAATGIC